jgi:hypothetical protein
MTKASPTAERVAASRSRNSLAGLRRVDVIVPANQVETIRAYAQQLRKGSQPEALVRVRRLIASAYQRFHASCLDNISVDPDRANFADAAVVAAALIHRGNAEAYKLGQQIRKLAR